MNVQCLICKKDFKSEELVKKHTKNMHEENERIRCEFCSVSAPNKSKLRTHVKQVHCELSE